MLLSGSLFPSIDPGMVECLGSIVVDGNMNPLKEYVRVNGSAFVLAQFAKRKIPKVRKHSSNELDILGYWCYHDYYVFLVIY